MLFDDKISELNARRPKCGQCRVYLHLLKNTSLLSNQSSPQCYLTVCVILVVGVSYFGPCRLFVAVSDDIVIGRY